MSLDLASIDHNCNVVRRQMEEEFRNFSPIFLVHRSGEREKTLVDKRNVIFAKPYGRKVYDYLTMTKEIDQDRTTFLGILVNQNKLVGVPLKKHYAAVFFINADDFHHDEYAQHHLYHLAWHALHALEDTSTRHAKTYFPQTRLFKPSNDKLEQSKNNLMADIFGAVMMETLGHKGFILQLAKKLSADSLKATTHFFPETHPYPIAYEASKMVYDDLKPLIESKSKLIQQIMDLSYEVSLTYGDDALRQWWSFVRPAQEMAWQGIAEDKILGQAIYTSKDTFVRALAYQIAELVDIEPDSAADQNAYNPFAGNEYNARIHKIKCSETGQRIASIAILQNNSAIYYAEAQKQNQKLIEGTGCGWCAHALYETAQHFEKMIATQDDINADHLFDIFTKISQKTSWDYIRKIANYMHQLRRKDANGDYETLITITSKLKNAAHLHDYFKICTEAKESTDDQNPAISTHTKEDNPLAGKAAQYIKDPSITKSEIKTTHQGIPVDKSQTGD